MTEQPRWVLDTNILISRLLAPRGTAAMAVDHALNSGCILVSDATLAELVEVLWRTKFDRYLTSSQRREFVGLLSTVTRKVHITRQFQLCRDPRDDKFIDLALNGQARAIVTGDLDLLVLHPLHGVDILTPAQFVGRKG
jgi:putative PIN family toxin of toxin-antitoxin system